MRALLVVTVLIVALSAKELYDSKSYVTPVNSLSFENQVNKIKKTTKQVSIIHFYKSNDGKSEGIAQIYNQFATDYRGMYRICAVDCDSQAKLCSKERVTNFPTVRVYPPVPIPNVDFEGDMDSKKLLHFASRYVESNVVEVNETNINTFITESPAVPKAILFTDKPHTPLILRSLSNSFDGKIFFGIVRKSAEGLFDRYNIRQTPKLIVVIATEKRPKPYTGEMKFGPMFEFLNIYSQTFVPGGGSAADTAATKYWLTEMVPEMHEKSSKDICLGVEGVLCVIVLSNGRPQQTVMNDVKALHDSFEQKLKRGSSFKFMWLDAQKEAPWAEVLSGESMPRMVVLNPGKRKRFVLHEGELTYDSMRNTLEKINGGDARFKMIKGGELPSFASRQ